MRLTPLNGDSVFACTFVLKFEHVRVLLSLLLHMYLCLRVYVSVWEELAVIPVLCSVAVFYWLLQLDQQINT